MKRPTLRDIAALAHVTHVTVSMALRKHPNIPVATREKIEKIAKEIGYHPDPALSALMIYRRGAKASRYQATLAWIDTSRRTRSATGDTFISRVFLGARERSEELGYRLEEFRTNEMDVSFDRLSKILYSRNIQGVLFAPHDQAHAHINYRSFDWARFSAISFGFSLASPKLDVIVDAQYRTARTAVRRLRALGYRKIGYAAYHEFDERTDGNFLGGFLTEQLRSPVSSRIPPLACLGKDFDKECRKWFRRYKPDAIFAPVPDVARALKPEELKKCGIAMNNPPEDLAHYAGIRQDYRILGQIGIDEVVAMIHTNRRGIPTMPKRIMVEGYWQDGPSAPRVIFQ